MNGPSAVLKTVNGELVPDNVLRVDNFHEKLALVNAVISHSDEKCIKLAKDMPFDYWNSVHFTVNPFFSTPISPLDCKIQFCKLLDSYTYLLRHLIDWPPSCLQRLWPMFALFHKFHDLTPFNPKITEVRIQYDTYPKSAREWVTGGDFVSFQRSMMSSLPLIKPNSIERPIIGYCDVRAQGDEKSVNDTDYFKIPTEEAMRCLSSSELTKDELSPNPSRESEMTSKSSTSSAMDVKSIVKAIVSKLSVGKEDTQTESGAYCTWSTDPKNEFEIATFNNGNDSPSNDVKSEGLNSEWCTSDEVCHSKEEKERVELDLADELVIIDCVKANMKKNEFLLNFRKPKFWECVSNDAATKLHRPGFDVEAVFKRYIRLYMDILLNKERFSNYSSFMEMLWPLFPHIHDLDVSYFVSSSEADKYKLLREEFPL